jgi:hypothetical protein
MTSTRERTALDRGLRSLRRCTTALGSRGIGTPCLPHELPAVGSERYWGDQILILREQLSALNEEPQVVLTPSVAGVRKGLFGQRRRTAINRTVGRLAVTSLLRKIIWRTEENPVYQTNTTPPIRITVFS